MAIKKYRPTTPGRRFMSVQNFSEISSDKPERSLLESKNKSGGRNAEGRITVRHIGGGNRNKYRIIDFKRDKDGVPAKVKAFSTTPTAAPISLCFLMPAQRDIFSRPWVQRATAYKRPGSDIKSGNAMPLSDMPVGTIVHNIELHPARRSDSAAQSSAQLSKEGNKATTYAQRRNALRSPCVQSNGRASGNIEHEIVNLAREQASHGYQTHRSRLAMNPNDHPHGGGEGRPISIARPDTWASRPWDTRRERKRTGLISLLSNA